MPLRWRLLAVALGLIVVALVLSAIVVSALLRAYLVDEVGQELQTYSNSIAVLAPGSIASSENQPSGFTLRIVGADGTTSTSLLEATPEADRLALPVLAPTARS